MRTGLSPRAFPFFSLMFPVCFSILLISFLIAPDPAATDASTSDTISDTRVYHLTLDGPITPASEDLLRSALATAASVDADLVFFQIDTPGGLVTSMREMVQLMLSSPVPVCVWVGPGGAHAASAGVFLVAASTIAAMSPEATIGAASPVGLGGKDVPETMARKVINDMQSLLRGMADNRNRNVEWYMKSVSEAATLTAQEAVLEQVVEFIATSRDDFFEQLSSRALMFHGEHIAIDGGSIAFIEHRPGFRHSFLSWLLHPQIAYLLFLGGLAGLFFELTNPGTFFPGILGGMCLLLGLYAMSVLPTNAAGVLLILFGLVLFLLELKITSFGLLGIAATACLFVGSVILFPALGGGMSLPLSTIIATVAAVAVIFAAAIYLVTSVHLKRSVTGEESLIGSTGRVTEWQGTTGKISLQGALWNARAKEQTEFAPGDEATVVALEGLTLIVNHDQPDHTS